MTQLNRTEYSARNAALGTAAKVLCIIFGYATRVVFIRMFTAELVGINGLLSNVLGAFTLPKLGVDTALVYAMYAPVAQGDKAKQRQLLRLYRRVYWVFALIISCVGLGILPFLPRLIGQQLEGLHAIYILFLASTISSYVFAEQGLVFLVYQRNYINELLVGAGLLTQNALQIALLFLTRNYCLFLITNTVCTLLRNLCISLLCRREYPFLFGEKTLPLPKREKKNILRDIRAMLLHKTGSVIINCTDNLLLTRMFSLSAVGRYANYYLILGSAEQVLRVIIYGVTASVGNVGVTEDRFFVGRIFRICVFTAFWIYATAAAALFSLLDCFVSLSFGADYVLPRTLTLILCLNLFLNGMRNATLVFRDALGLFRRDWWKTIVEALVNLGVSILLALLMGMEGVFLGTTVSIVLVSLWVEPLVLYRGFLKTPMLPYFTRFAAYLLTAAAATGLTWLLCRGMPEGFVGLLLRLPLSLIVPTALMALLWHRSGEFRALWDIALPYLRNPIRQLRSRSGNNNGDGDRNA